MAQANVLYDLINPDMRMAWSLGERLNRLMPPPLHTSIGAIPRHPHCGYRAGRPGRNSLGRYRQLSSDAAMIDH